jgi:hypothetical protein
MEAGGAAGSSRALRLDPFALPVRFPASDAGADGRVRQVELDRERVVMRREVRGIRMAVGVRMADFRGVALRLNPSQEDQPALVEVLLLHRDSGLSTQLLLAADGDDVTAIWKAWGRVLGLPLLVAEPDGTLREPFPRLGGVEIRNPKMRRRRRSVMRRRRPTIFLRRTLGCVRGETIIHRDEREIVARN